MELLLSTLTLSMALVIMTHMLTTREIRISRTIKNVVDAPAYTPLPPVSEQELEEDFRKAYELTKEMQRLFLDDDQIDREGNNGN